MNNLYLYLVNLSTTSNLSAARKFEEFIKSKENYIKFDTTDANHPKFWIIAKLDNCWLCMNNKRQRGKIVYKHLSKTPKWNNNVF